MDQADIKALPALQGLAVLKDRDGVTYIQDLKTWSRFEERAEYRRHQIEAMAHADMTPRDLYVFLARASGEAVKSWNASQTLLGRVGNMLTNANPGYAEVPGRVMQQIMALTEEEGVKAFSPVATFLLRADVAVQFRDHLKDLFEVGA